MSVQSDTVELLLCLFFCFLHVGSIQSNNILSISSYQLN